MADSKPRADALAKKLRDSLAQRRPRPWKLVLGALVGSTLILVLLVWWLYPRARQAPLQVVAFDAVFTLNETPNARAGLLVPAGEEPRRLSGYTIIFQEQRLMLPAGTKPRAIEASSDGRGQASVEWPMADAAVAEFMALHVDVEQRKGSTPDRGRIFVWPADAPLFIVDADETLIADGLDPQASETLTRAATEGWRIVYLATASSQLHEFRTARDWIAAKPGQLPIGPVLPRPKFAGDETLAQVRHGTLKQLTDRLRGPKLAVVRTAESAQVCKELGVRAILIGSPDAPTWADVPVKLK